MSSVRVRTQKRTAGVLDPHCNRDYNSSTNDKFKYRHMTIIIQSLIGRNAEFLVFPHVMIPKTKNLVLYDLDNNNNRKLLSKNNIREIYKTYIIL